MYVGISLSHQYLSPDLLPGHLLCLVRTHTHTQTHLLSTYYTRFVRNFAQELNVAAAAAAQTAKCQRVKGRERERVSDECVHVRGKFEFVIET